MKIKIFGVDFALTLGLPLAIVSFLALGLASCSNPDRQPQSSTDRDDANSQNDNRAV